MTYNPEREIDRYLARLSKAARRLPRGRRRELVTEIEQHIREAVSETPVESEAELLTLLDRVGAPDEIVAAASGPPNVTRSTTMETWAIILLLIGGFVWGGGWIAGVILLWSSSLWTTRDKLIGTFVVPGGLASAFFLLFFASGGSQDCHRAPVSLSPGSGGHTHPAGQMICTGGASTLGTIGLIALFAVVLIGPIASSIYLVRRLNKEKHALAAAT